MKANYLKQGEGRSLNATIAEHYGLLPISKIGKTWSIKLAGKLIDPEEWHHTGMYANETNYFDSEKIKKCAKSLKDQAQSQKMSGKDFELEILKKKEKRSLNLLLRQIHGYEKPKFKMSQVVWINGESTGITYRELIQILNLNNKKCNCRNANEILRMKK
jgi:hypothetical protein